MKLFTEATSKILMWSGILLLVIGLFFFLWRIEFDRTQQIDSAKFGQFGDFFGGIIGSIWAFAGVILFYIALTEQREDIKTNRKVLNTQVNVLEQQIREFELQRQELELTREVFTDQSKTLKAQQFESTFFNSMNLLNNIIGNINYKKYPERTKLEEDYTGSSTPDIAVNYMGRESFLFFYDEFRKEYEDILKDYYTKNKSEEVYSENMEQGITLDKMNDLVNGAYENFFDRNHSKLGHYFRTIYNIIKLVKDRKPENQKYYTGLLRSQLSAYEHLLLFYNCNYTFNQEKFKPLIVEYSMLDNMPIGELLNLQHVSFYDQKAYE